MQCVDVEGERPIYHFGPGAATLVLFDGGAKLLGDWAKFDLDCSTVARKGCALCYYSWQ